MTSPRGTPLTGVPDLGREGSLPPEPGWGAGPASLKNTPQRAQGLVVVDVCGAQGRHHRRPRVPTCGKKTRPCRRSAHGLVLPSRSPPTFTAGGAEAQRGKQNHGPTGWHRGALGCSRERPGIHCLCSSGQPKTQSISLGINFPSWGGPLSLYLGERHFSLHLPTYCYWLQTQAERRRGDLWQLPKPQQAESRVPAIEGETKAQGLGVTGPNKEP